MNFELQRFAYGFVEPKVATLKVDIDTNANGNIAQTGETATGTKTISFNGFKAAGTFTDAQTVFNKILVGIAGATPDEYSAQRTVTAKVDETE